MLRAHAILLNGVRGRTINPGQIRSTYVVVGDLRNGISSLYVAPPADKVALLLQNWLDEVNNKNPELPFLIHLVLYNKLPCLTNREYYMVNLRPSTPFLMEMVTNYSTVDNTVGRLGRLIMLWMLTKTGRIPNVKIL